MKTLPSLVLSRSFPYHSHSDEIQRKFFRIREDGLFEGQQGLLDWVRIAAFGDLITRLLNSDEISFGKFYVNDGETFGIYIKRVQ